MMCSICMKYGKRQLNKEIIWVTKPCTRIRRESLTEHEKSKLHVDASSHICEKRLLEETGVGEIERSISAFQNMQRDAFVGALRSIYWLAKNELPHTTLFEKLLNQCKAMGCSYLQHLEVGRNANYTSERIMQELLEVLESEIKSTIIKKLHLANYFSILCDEATDVSVLKQLIIYAKYINIKEKDTEVSFLGVSSIPDGKAETITNKLVEIIDGLGLKVHNLVGLGSDGTAVMIGKHKGVAKLLKDKTDGLLLNCHCTNHRLALASAQAAAEIPFLVKFKDILRQLFFFHQNSAVRMAGLTKIQNLLDDPHIKLKMASDTRWLSHDKAVKSLRECIVSVVTSLEREATERNDVTAEGLAKNLKTFNFVASLLMFSDILPHLSNLSKAWQRQDVDLTEVEPILESTILHLQELINYPGKYFRNLQQYLEGEWSDLQVTYVQANVTAFKATIYDKYINNIIQHLEARFPDLPVMSCFSKMFKEGYETSASEILFDYYSMYGHPPILNYEDSKLEWAVVSKMLKSETYKGLTPRQLLLKLATTSELNEPFRNLSRLATVGLSLPVSTAECERGFSALKRIKTCLRNRMNESTLNNLMLISLEGPDVNIFDFEKAADNWASRKKRRINLEPK